MKLRYLLPLVALLFVAAAKKQPGFSVRFHTETNPQDTDQFSLAVQMENPPRTVHISKIPAINERDVAAIYPFKADDNTMGCAFKLDEHGTLALDTLSVEKHGNYLFCYINGRMVSSLLIDKRVSDGIITISRGLAAQEIAMLQKHFRTLKSTGATKQ